MKRFVIVALLLLQAAVLLGCQPGSGSGQAAASIQDATAKGLPVMVKFSSPG